MYVGFTHLFMVFILPGKVSLTLQQSLPCCLGVSFLRNTLASLPWHQWLHLIFSQKVKILILESCKRKCGYVILSYSSLLVSFPLEFWYFLFLHFVTWVLQLGVYWMLTWTAKLCDFPIWLHAIKIFKKEV